ncbi:hypothetical protein ACLB2K_072891 [Fragaria x ananassa]
MIILVASPSPSSCARLTGFPTTNTLRDDDDFIGYYGDQVAGKTSNSFKEEYGDVVATTSDKLAFPEEAWRSPATSTFNVMNYGAVGNGEVDDTQAFLKAWEDVCGSTQGIPTLIIPKGKDFLLNSVKFQGPCRAASVNFQALHINDCHGLRLSDITHIDSARNHISISGCNDVEVSGILIRAPADSPNTDGIDISISTNINIRDSSIGTGDDCIAINSGTSHVNITGVLCGPGHGISIGSLGEHGSYSMVEDVQVRKCTFNGTTNGARIKTWKGSVSGDVAITLDCDNRVGCKNIVMDHIHLTSSVHGKKVAAYCKNVRGLHTSLSPSVACD